MFHRAYGGLLALCLVALVLSAFIFLGGNIIEGLSGSKLSEVNPAPDRATLTFLPQHVIPAERTLRGFVSIALPSRLFQNLVDDSPGSHATTCPTGSSLVHPIYNKAYRTTYSYCTVVDCHINPLAQNERYCTVVPAYAQRKLVLHVIESDPNGNITFDTTTSVRLSAVFDYKYTGEVHVPIDVPLRGDQRSFPEDHYSAFMSMVMLIPGVHDVNDVEWNVYKLQFNQAFNYPSSEILSGGENISTTRRLIARGGNHQYISGHTISIDRSITEILYVYIVAITPLVFALLFVHLLFFNPRYNHEPIQEFMAALVAAILAILPLRIILVPPEVGGLTRVDILLGIGLISIVSAAVAKYVLEIWRADREGNRILAMGRGGETVDQDTAPRALDCRTPEHQPGP